MFLRDEKITLEKILKGNIIITMDWNFVLNYLRQGDSYEAKFFGSITSLDDFGQTLVAMANTKGGYIFIGVDVNNYHLKGTDVDRSFVDSVIQQFCTPKPSIDVSFVNKNEKVICVVYIKETNQKPYYYKRKCYVMDVAKTKLALLEQNTSEKTQSEESLKKDAVTEVINPDDLKNITSELLELSDEIPTDELDLLSTQSKTEELTINMLKQDVEVDQQTKITHPSSEQVAAFENYTDKLSPNNSVEQIQTNNLTDNKSKPALNERQTLALEYLEEEQFIKNKTYRELFDVSHKTAHLELVDLVDRKHIKSQGSGRSTCYVLNTTKQQTLL